MLPGLRNPGDPNSGDPDSSDLDAGAPDVGASDTTGPDSDRPSKTQRKKRMHELQSLGVRLVELNAGQLAAIELPEDLRDAVADAKHMKSFEARRRQLQYIGRLMREADAAPIRERLAAWDGQSRAHTAREHEIGRWRDRLMEDDGALTEFASGHPRLDTQRLRLLVRNARAERDAGRAPRSCRELYRALRETLRETAGDAPAAGAPRENEA